jgi:hypothetical protein
MTTRGIERLSRATIAGIANECTSAASASSNAASKSWSIDPATGSKSSRKARWYARGRSEDGAEP